MPLLSRKLLRTLCALLLSVRIDLAVGKMVGQRGLPIYVNRFMRWSRGWPHYSLGTVHEEYGRLYTDLGQMHKALEYFDLAQTHLPEAKFWKLLLMISRAVVLIKDGEFQEGTRLALEAANETRSTGVERYLERLYDIQNYLAEEEDRYARKQRELRQIGASLREALNGGNGEV